MESINSFEAKRASRMLWWSMSSLREMRELADWKPPGKHILRAQGKCLMSSYVNYPPSSHTHCVLMDKETSVAEHISGTHRLFGQKHQSLEASDTA